MKIVKKLLFIVLILTVILASMVPAAAQTSEKTTQEKAVVLGSLRIISGVNGEYHLENPLRRNEAATFIVRLIGKEIMSTRTRTYTVKHPIPTFLPPNGTRHSSAIATRTESSVKHLNS